MASERMPTLPCIQIEQLRIVVHRSRSREIARVMHSDTPNRLDMVLEGMRAGCVYEVPNLDR
jgi:hypothetical protein